MIFRNVLERWKMNYRKNEPNCGRHCDKIPSQQEVEASTLRQKVSAVEGEVLTEDTLLITT